MAEEIASQEAELGKGAPDLQDLNNQAINKIKEIESSLNLPAKPSSIDAYHNVAGNPLTGSNPSSKNPASTVDFIHSLDKAVANDTTADSNIYGAMRPFSYNGDYDGANFQRYYSSGDLYNKLGFSPYRDNESLYNDKMTFGDQFVRAASQWDNLVGTGFMSGVKSWGTMFTDPLAPDIEGAREMDRAMAIGSSRTGGIGGFLTNTFLNSGYTIGIGADFLAEELALMGTTALTGGILGATNVPLMMGRGLKLGSKIAEGTKNIFGASKRMDQLREVTAGVNEARGFWNSVGKGGKAFAKETANILNPLDQTVAALKATDYANDYAKISKTFGAFADDLLMMKGAVSEAKLEGGMAKINITKDLIDQFRAENGTEPQAEDMAKIEAIANEEAYRTAFWNLPAITTSNKLLYATMLAPVRNLMGREGAVKLIDDYVFSNKTFSAVGDSFISKGKAALQSFKSPKFYGQFGMNYLKANLAEGVQENIQEAISSGASSHAKALYDDPIRAAYEGYMPHFMKGVGEQFSAEGAETFAGGFAMGMFAQPIMSLPSVGISKLIKSFDSENYKTLEKLKNEVHAQNVEHLNKLYDRAIIHLAPDLENSIRTGRLSDDVFTAARNGNKKEAIDAIESIKDNYLLTALKTGKLDIILDKIADYKNFSREEAVEAFGKYGIKEEDVDSALNKIDGIVARGKQLKKDYEDVAENYPNPFNPSNFRLGTEERKTSEYAYKAWEEAKYNLMFAKATYTSHSKRIADVAQIFSGISNDLAKADAQNLMTLLDPITTQAELSTLKKEVSVLDDSIPEQRKLKSEKTKQIEKLGNFYNAINSIKSAKHEDEKIKLDNEAKKAFLDYVKFLAKKNDNIVFNQDINKAYEVVRDHMSLKNDMKNLARNINVLMTPQNFFDLHSRLTDAYKDIVENKEETIKNNQKTSEKRQNLNDVLNDILTNEGLTVPEEFVAAYSEAMYNGETAPIPTSFRDASGNVVTSGPNFETAVDKWKKFIAITIKPKEENQEVVTETAKVSESVKTKEDKIEDNTKKLAAKPRESLTSAEEKALRYGLPGSSTLELRKQFIEKRIELLEKKADALGLDAIEITDTLNYLNGILNSSVDATQNTLATIQKQIDTLANSIKSKTSKKTSRGVKALEKIAELKASYRSEFQLLNDITDRVKELQEELSDIQAIQKDLEKQAEYYNSLLADPTLTTYTREELTARRDKLNGKINTIGKLLEAVKKAIYDSIRYIREHVNALLQADKKIKTFISENEYENFQYPAIKNKIESLQNEALNNMESVDFLEKVKLSEEEKQARLLEALLNYQDQVRYLEELIYNYKEGEIGDRFKDMNLNVEEIVNNNQSEYPVTISRKNARIEKRIKEAKAQQKEVEQVESVELPVEKTETTSENVVSEFVLESPSTQELNQDLTLQSLKTAKAYNYEVIYDNIQYKIENIGSNSVTLKSALGKKAVVNESNLKKNLKVVKPGVNEATVEENDTIKYNEKIVEETPKTFSKEEPAKKGSLEEYKLKFKKSIC